MIRTNSASAALAATVVSATWIGSAMGAMVRPDSATAGSTFSGLYDIGNAIDGSGLPVGFTPADAHADYAVNNHWTTTSGAVQAGTAWASFFFYYTTPVEPPVEHHRGEPGL
jgi:hypothetical protein